MNTILLEDGELNRRQIMAEAARSILGVGLLPGFLSPQAFASNDEKKAKAKNVIYLYMDGGMSHVDTLDPKSRSEERRVGKECRSRWSPYH